MCYCEKRSKHYCHGCRFWCFPYAGSMFLLRFQSVALCCVGHRDTHNQRKARVNVECEHSKSAPTAAHETRCKCAVKIVLIKWNGKKGFATGKTERKYSKWRKTLKHRVRPVLQQSFSCLTSHCFPFTPAHRHTHTHRHCMMSRGRQKMSARGRRQPSSFWW